jgi:tetratricopeptide (TPR) repeat protein
MSRVVRASRSPDEDDGRRWHIPPPVLGLTGVTGPEGQVILEEVEGDAGPLLWRTFRSVATWAETRNADRGDVFPATLTSERRAWIEAIDLPGELSEPLTVLASLLDTDSSTDDTAAGEAVGEIGKWATSAGFVRTGAEFHQLACSVRRSDPALALEAATATRDLADYARAEVWLQRAIGLSRRVGEWRIYIESHLAYSNMLRRRGNMPGARRFADRALRRARRQGLRGYQASALHDLFVIESECSNFDRAEVLAGQAFRTYPEDHPVLPWVVHDMAYLWINRRNFPPALAVLKAVEPLVAHEQKPSLLGALAISAGGSGDAETFDAAVSRLQSLRAGPGVAEAWLEAADGAAALGRMEEAVDWAGRSLGLARDRSERKIEFLAEKLLTALRKPTPVEPPAQSPRTYPELATTVVNVLSRRRARHVTAMRR